MPKTPITLSIARSKWALAAPGALLVALALLTGYVLGVILGVALLLLGGVALLIRFRRQPKGQLGLRRDAQAEVWAWWLTADGVARNEVLLRCDYLGPWLIGLKRGRERLWLWPDSLDGESQRCLRRLFHPPGR